MIEKLKLIHILAMKKRQVDEIEEYTKKAAQFWQKEIQEGATIASYIKN